MKFEPAELRERLSRAFASWREFMDIEWYSIDEEDFDDSSDVTITEDTLVTDLSLPRTDESFSLTVKELLQWDEELSSSKLIARSELRTPKRTLVYVSPRDELAHSVSMSDLEFPVHEVLINGHPFKISMRIGVTLFGMKIAQEGTHEKWCPPCSSQDRFIEILYDIDDQNAVQSLVDSYLFELDTSLGVRFARDRYEEPASPDWVEQWEAQVEKLRASMRLRPLLHGSGMKELLRLFNSASDSSDLEIVVLGYTKVIEYIAATVIKLQSHGVIRTRLLSSEAMKPDAAFIDGLISLVDDQRVFQKDSEAIKLAIETCCDAGILSKYSPNCVSELKRVSSASKPEEIKRALHKFSDCLTATRNQIVHAKTNYTAKGAECPESQLEQLAECARLACQQSIRWFANIPEEFRVLR